MGIAYDGKLIVGLRYDEINISKLPDYDEEDRYECLDNSGLMSASPYYDAPLEDCIIGFDLGNLPLNTELYVTTIEVAKSKFIKLFGVTPELIGTQDIW